MHQIVIQNLTKEIKGTVVLEDVSLEMNSGHVYGLQGINGSGKTMLMRAIIGFIRPSSGYVSYDGKIIGKDREFLDNIGFLIENPVFLNRYTGLDNLKLLASIRKIINEEEIRKWLQFVGLEDAMDKKYRKYSLGMKQRLGIANAVMESPEVLILDEPTNALDEDGVDMVLKLINSEKEKGTLVIVACHDFEILKRMADEIFVLNSGKIVAHQICKV